MIKHEEKFEINIAQTISDLLECESELRKDLQCWKASVCRDAVMTIMYLTENIIGKK